jgi:ADP-ribosylglycohydrolase
LTVDQRRTKQHYLGCLLGGAVGDALGAPIEFMSLAAIRRKFGIEGLTDYASAFGRLGAITDDTQMTLFTAEAVIRSHNRFLDRGLSSPADVARLAYFRWLRTQGEDPPSESHEPGWLIQQKGLFSRRAPGNTCLSALRAGARGTPEEPINDSKGCGGVMRMAPVGLVAPGMLDPFVEGMAFAALTHGHPSGYLSAGFLAQLIYELADGQALGPAVEVCIRCLKGYKGYEETLAAVTGAMRLAATGRGDADELEQLGGGWVGEEALAIALYCAFRADTFEEGVLLAVNHGGDSDSTGSIAGNILGLIHGVDAIPKRWLKELELREVIEEVATDLWLHFGDGEKPEGLDQAKAKRPFDWEKYPGN